MVLTLRTLNSHLAFIVFRLVSFFLFSKVSIHMKTKRFFFSFLTKKKKRINVSTGSANGQDWGVIDFPRNQSACWESTAHPDQTVAIVGKFRRENRREENNILSFTHVFGLSFRCRWQHVDFSLSDREAGMCFCRIHL